STFEIPVAGVLPMAFWTTQVSTPAAGWVETVTWYACPETSGVGNVNAWVPVVFPVSGRSPWPSSCRTTDVPVTRPTTVPPTVGPHCTATFVTLCDAIIPLPVPGVT